MASPLLPGHVIRFVDADAAAGAPHELPTLRPLRRTTRVVLATLLIIASMVAGDLVFVLWTQPTPGAWFSALFTLMLAALVAALWFAYAAALRDSAARVAARDGWAAAGPAGAVAGVIVARDVSTREDGQVGSFDLAVRLAEGTEVNGRWQPSTASGAGLLQPQVPVVGQAVTVWMLAHASAADPHVIDVVDPSAHRRA